MTWRSCLAPLVSLALLAALFAWLKPTGLGEALSRLTAWHVGLGLVLVQAQILLSALRWRFTAARLGLILPLGLAVREYYVASLLNQTLPGGVAGDVARAWRARHGAGGDWRRPAKAVLFERLSGQVALVCVALPGLAFWPELMPPLTQSTRAPVLLALAALAVVLTGLAFWRRYRRRLGRQGEPMNIGTGEQTGRLSADLAAAFWYRGAGFVQGALSLAILGAYLATFALASEGIGAALPPLAVITILPLCLTAMLIPAGIGGWGSRELAAAALWPLVGFSATQGLTASLVYGALCLAGSLPGLIWLIGSSARARADSDRV